MSTESIAAAINKFETLIFRYEQLLIDDHNVSASLAIKGTAEFREAVEVLKAANCH